MKRLDIGIMERGRGLCELLSVAQKSASSSNKLLGKPTNLTENILNHKLWRLSRALNAMFDAMYLL
jgi:hypothetical protein